MYTKTSLQHRLGTLDALWVLHTTVQGVTEQCYFFGMKGLFYQARLAPSKFGHYLVQVESLPDDVEALELPVPAGTEVTAVVEEEGGDSIYLALVLSQGVLRYSMDGEDYPSAVSMAYTKDAAIAEIAQTVDICGYEHTVIALPETVRNRYIALYLAAVILFAAGCALLPISSLAILLIIVGVILICLGPYMPIYRCPYCRKAHMRQFGGYSLDELACPVCGEICKRK